MTANKDRKWIDLTEPKNDERKFVSLVDESKDVDKDHKVDLKATILEHTILDLIFGKAKSLVIERRNGEMNQSHTVDNGENQTKENLYNTQTWSEFEEQAKVILTLLNTKEEQANQTITKLRKLFSNLGDGDASRGLGFFKELDKYLVDCGGENT